MHGRSLINETPAPDNWKRRLFGHGLRMHNPEGSLPATESREVPAPFLPGFSWINREIRNSVEVEVEEEETERSRLGNVCPGHCSPYACLSIYVLLGFSDSDLFS